GGKLQPATIGIARRKQERGGFFVVARGVSGKSGHGNGQQSDGNQPISGKAARSSDFLVGGIVCVEKNQRHCPSTRAPSRWSVALRSGRQLFAGWEWILEQERTRRVLIKSRESPA